VNVSLLAGLALIVAAPAAKDPPKKDAPTVVGAWSVESAVKGGKKDNSPPGASLELTADGKMVLHEAGKDIPGSYKSDPKKDPPEIDLIIDDAKAGMTFTLTGIYKLDGDMLQICLSFGADRPKTFESPETAPQVLLTLKRTKKD
jgi:uncharacterized protein (TIGR03067 family)